MPDVLASEFAAPVGAGDMGTTRTSVLWAISPKQLVDGPSDWVRYGVRMLLPAALSGKWLRIAA